MRPGYYDPCAGCSERSNVFSSLVLILIGSALGMVLITALKACEAAPQPVAVQLDCQGCHSRTVAMVEYFRRMGSKTPEDMAYAVLNTKSPRLLAAISKVESGGNPNVRNSGYKKRHHGAYQVNPEHWGEVPHDAVGQALQAERILSELTGDMPLKKALSLYGGDSSDRYQRKVLAELVRVP